MQNKTIKEIFRLTDEMVANLKTQELDDVAKVQVLQSLVAAKLKVEDLLPKLSPSEQEKVEAKLTELLDEIEALVESIDFSLVQHVLEEMSEQVSGMLKLRQQQGPKVIRE